MVRVEVLCGIAEDLARILGPMRARGELVQQRRRQVNIYKTYILSVSLITSLYYYYYYQVL